MPRLIGLTLAYLGVTLVMTQAMIDLRALDSAVYRGDPRLIVWTLAWANHAVIDGVPLFDANIYFPAATSLQYTEHLTGISLFTLPIYAFTRNPILAYNLIWLLSFVLNALAMHLLAWRHTRSHLAAATAALVFTFSFYRMLQAHGHLPQIWTWLVPLSLWLLERWIARPTLARAAAWGAAVVLQSLGSWYVAVMVVLINAIAIAWWHASMVRDRWLTRAWQLGIVTAAGAAIVAPFALLYRTLFTPSVQEVAGFSTAWQAYVIPPAATFPGQWWLQTIGRGPMGIYGEYSVFLGWIAMAVAITGAIALVRRRAWVWAGITLTCVGLGIWLSLGPSHIDGVEQPSLFGLLASLPGVSGFRAPARFAFVALTGMALLAAEGMRAAQERFGARASLAAVVLWPLMLFEWFVPAMPSGRPTSIEIPAIYKTSEVRNARSLVSLPDYDGYQWWMRADYLYFSTAHWRPIVNGYGRADPPDYRQIMSYMRAFPGPNNARKMRELGIEYVVFHGDRYEGDVDAVVQDVVQGGEYEFVLQIGSDYLFRVRPASAGRSAPSSRP